MARNRRTTRSVCAFALLISVLLTGFFGVGASAAGDYYNGSDSLYRTSLDDVESILTATTYQDYLAQYGYSNYVVNEEGKFVLSNGGYATFDKYGNLVDADGELVSKDMLVPKDIKEINLSLSTSDEAGSVNGAIVGYAPKGELTEEEEDATWTSGTFKIVDELSDYKGNVLICGDDSTITWTVTVEEDVLYNIFIEYYTGDFDFGENCISKSTAAERYVLIDGLVPYKEARSVELDKKWVDAYPILDENGKYTYDENDKKQVFYSNSSKFEEFVGNLENAEAEVGDRIFATDSTGNELKPEKAVVSDWNSTFVYDSTGYFSEPLSFYLSKGTHTISLQSIREPVAIKGIKLCLAEENDTYEEYVAKYSEYYDGEPIKIQAEFPTYTSGNTIYALNDRASSYSEPQDASLISLNMIGGDKWQYVGQWIEWEVTVPNAGFYDIALRSRQNFYSGIYVSRAIYINGNLPFEEAGNLRFSYSSDWQTGSLNSGENEETGELNEYMFFLNEGKNTIRLQVVLGDMAGVLSAVENSLSNINKYYRKILMITGPDPDDYRDYGFDKLIPDVIAGLAEEAEILNGVSAKLDELVGEKGEHGTTLDRVALTCERMSSMPSKIASELTTLKDNTASLGTWLSDTQNQPLEIDYIVLQPVGEDAPDAEPGFFGSLWYEIKKFFVSFFSDYNNLGASGEETNSASDVDVTVWTATSRDQAQILRTLVDDNFTPNYEGISVDIKLVAGGTLLPATLSGTGPDVYLGATQGDPVNYAIRSAVLSLNTKTGDTTIGYDFTDLENSIWNEYDEEKGEYKYPAFNRLIENNTVKDFNEVSEWFVDQALVPLTLYGETYGLPMTMSFAMMFYRKDIFVELGINVPNTWDDFYDIIYTLQSNALDIGFPQGTGGSMILMYQQDEPLYDEGNYDYYLELFRRYYYNGDYANISDEELAEVDAQIAKDGLTYVNDEGATIPKTDGMTINLDSDISLSTFKDVCQLFTMYDFPVTYDPANRFRSGEMPLMIQDYTVYNTLIIFAPEINGLWEFTSLPGTADELTKEINNVTIGTISAVMMMNSVADDEKKAFGSWAFMQWYLGADIQSAYGNEMVALLGPSAKQPTSNIEALANMAWSTEEYNNLFSQFNAVTCTPEYPGSYIIGRYTNFAYLDVINNSADPVDELRSYISDINVELARKRSEFRLPTTDSIKEMLETVNEKYPDWDEGR